MKNLNHLKHLSLSVLILTATPLTTWPQVVQGGDTVITKTLLNASGRQLMQAGDTALAMAVGEPMAGVSMTSGDTQLISGYFGGRYGNGKTFQLIHSKIDTREFRQGGVQVGVSLGASIQLQFSDGLQELTIPLGVSVVALRDHVGQALNTPVAMTSSYDAPNKMLTLVPTTAWQANTVYTVVLTPDLLSVDGFTFETVQTIPFVSILDPHQENIVHSLEGLTGFSLAAADQPQWQIRIPSEALADFSMVLVSQNPTQEPLQVKSQTVEQANAKALAAGGLYRQPLAIREIVAYDQDGKRVTSLAKSVDLSLEFPSIAGTPASSIIRPGTLSFWILDEAHALWVKLPQSQAIDGSSRYSVPVNAFAVFALMGSPSGSAADSFVFPVPWRPHGPRAGTGSGQTGTAASGMTFSNLPSECKIRIYTVSGDLVRTLHHSDAAGGPLAQEAWDGRTSGGETVASGVYLWRVESSVDAKNGKLMIIR